MAAIVAHADGVYLNLRHADHVADWALGGGALKQLRLSPPDFWYDSVFNDVFEREAPKAQGYFARGEAAHALFLEGMGTYEAVYGVMPSKADYPDHLAGGRELADACSRLGLRASGTILELEDRLRARLPGVKLLSDRIAEFSQSGRKALPRSDDFRIRLLHRMAMMSTKELGLEDEADTLRDVLEGGLSEVSVFWTEVHAGVPIRHRARFDKIKPNITLDLKTLADWRRTFSVKSLLHEAVTKGYVIQAVQYQIGRQKLREFVKAKKIFGGTKAQRKVLREIAKAETWGWGWVFAKTTGFPAVKALAFNSPDTEIHFAEAYQQREEAIANFVSYYTFHGGLEGKVWFDPDVVAMPAQEDWPALAKLGGD